MTSIRACLLLASLAAAGIAQAQTSAPPVVITQGTAPTATKDDSSLTWNGITLYGIVDIGLQYQTHGAPISDYFPAGSESIISKNSNTSITGLTPNNLSQSRIGLSGLEPIPGGDFAFVFRLETFFNTNSGNISDALKSLTLNNGKALDVQGTSVDSSIAGQLFGGAAYAGVSSKTFGSLTFGRHTTPLADGIAKYDPMYAAQAFSVIGFSGTAGGGGDTEDRRLDDSVKYTAKYGPVHVGGLYQFNGANGGYNTAVQANLGADFLGGGSIDGYYQKKKDAVAAASLSAAMVQGKPAAGFTTCAPECSIGNNSLAGTISDNTTYSFMALYNFGKPKVFAGYEHIQFSNPDTPLAPGFLTIGGYQLVYVNNDAYAIDKTLKVIWAGGKYSVTDDLELSLAWYGYRQDSYAAVHCSDASSSKCEGELNAISAVADYKFTKRFDAYIGTMWSEVRNGLANGYLLKAPFGDSASTISSTIGIRFKF